MTTTIQQRSLGDILGSPYATGLEARRIVEELSAALGKAQDQLRTRLYIIFRNFAFNLTPEQKRWYLTGYDDGSRVFAPL